MRLEEIVIDNLRRLRRLISVRRMDEAEEAACKIVKYIFEDAPVLGLDLDGTIDEAPEFFRLLSRIWPGRVVIITCRLDESKARADADKFGVFYDELVTVRKLEEKAEAIEQTGVNVYVDDQDECLMDIPMDVTVLKIRNEGNFTNGKWLYSGRTGKQIC